MEIKKFVELEIKNSFYDLVSSGYFVWDVLREPIYTSLHFSDLDLRTVYSKSFKHHYLSKLIVLIKSLVLFLVSKQKDNLIICSSRFIDENGYHYDKVMADTISLLKEDSFVIEIFSSEQLAYKGIYTFDSLFQKLIKKPNLDNEVYQKIRSAFLKEDGNFDITYEDLNSIYRRFYAEERFYRFVIKRIKPKRILMNYGRPKAVISAAKCMNVRTALFQHGEIQNDVVEFVYPKSIEKAKIFFPDILFTFSNLWGEGMCIPTRIVSIGNNYYRTSYNSQDSEETVVFISSIYHANYLKKLAFDFAKHNQHVKIMYKLHPEESNNFNDLKIYFKEVINVSVLSDEYDTEEVIAKASIVVLISSTVLYSALDMNKKIAIYKRGNYHRNIQFLEHPNIYFIDDDHELEEAYNSEYIKNIDNSKYYEPYSAQKLIEALQSL